MSNKIDKRILEMEFDNKAFKNNVKDTQGALSDLSKSLEMKEAGSGLEKVQAKFSAFQAVAFGALAALGGMAVDAGLKMASSLWDPMVEGGKKRALAIEQAKFQFKGLGLDVEATMAAALYAVKGTSFGLDEAATAAAALGASRVPIDKMGMSLRAISGVAALAGASYSDVADVFTKVAGQGRLMGDDLNRLAARGVNAAATLANAMGISETEVRKLVSEGKIGFEEFAGYMDAAFGENATKASDTFSGAAANMRAALSRIGAAFATIDFEGQRRILNAFTPVLDNIAGALKPVIDAFAVFTDEKAKAFETIFAALNFQDLPDQPPAFFRGLQNIFEFLLSIAQPIRDAFKEIFPPATAEQIQAMAQGFLKFTEGLKLSEEASENLKRTFRGVFALFDIGWIVISQIVQLFVKLFGVMGGGNIDILNMTGNLGDFIVSVRDAIKNGDFFAKAFENVSKVIKNVGQFFKEAWANIKSFFAMDSIVQLWEKLGEAIQKVKEFLFPVRKESSEAGSAVADTLNNIVGNVKDFLGNLDLNVIMGALNFGAVTALTFTIGGLVNKFINGIKNALGGAGGGVIDTIKGAFDGLTGTFQAMQTKLKADVLIKIAGAIAIMAAALAVMAMIEPERLSSAMAGIVSSLAALIGTMALMIKFINPASMTKFTLLSVNMNLLAGAMVTMGIAALIFAQSIKQLSELDWVELAKGVSGLAAALGLMVGALKLMTVGPGSKGMVVAAGAILLISVSMIALAKALKDFADLSWEEIGRGMAAIGGMLAMMALFNLVVSKSKTIDLGALGFAVVSASLLLLAAAVQKFAGLSWEEIVRGLTALGGAMAILGIVLGALPIQSLAGAGALVLVSFVLGSIADSFKKFAQMEWDEIGRALVIMGGGLAIIAGAMALMGIPLVLLGSVGMIAAAFAMMMLAPALVLLGTMSWDDIGRGLTMLSASLAIMAVLGLLLIPASVGFLLLGAGILAIGGGVLMAAQGTLLFAAAFVALAGAAAIGAEGIKIALLTIADTIPVFASKIAEGVISFATTIAENAEEFTRAATALIAAMIEGINQNAPAIIDTIWMLVLLLAQKAEEGVPVLVESGMRLLIGLMQGINKHIDLLIFLGSVFLQKLIRGIGNEMPKLVAAGGDAVLNFVNGLTNYINTNAWRFQLAGTMLVVAIVNAVSRAIENSGSLMRWAGARIGNAILEGAKNALDINSPSKKFRDEIMGSVFEGVEEGGKKGESRAEAVGVGIGDAMATAVKKSVDHIRDAVASDMQIVPTITPVVDLSNVEESALSINKMYDVPTLDLSKSYVSAASLLASREAAEEAAAEARDRSEEKSGDTYNYKQEISSPKALPTSEIYRNTNNFINTRGGGTKDA